MKTSLISKNNLAYRRKLYLSTFADSSRPLKTLVTKKDKHTDKETERTSLQLIDMIVQGRAFFTYFLFSYYNPV